MKRCCLFPTSYFITIIIFFFLEIDNKSEKIQQKQSTQVINQQRKRRGPNIINAHINSTLNICFSFIIFTAQRYLNQLRYIYIIYHKMVDLTSIHLYTLYIVLLKSDRFGLFIFFSISFIRIAPFQFLEIYISKKSFSIF